MPWFLFPPSSPMRDSLHVEFSHEALQQKDMKNFLSFASGGIRTEREPLKNVKAFVKT